MSAPPSFSSFPDFSSNPSEPIASTSRAPQAPSFTSFPESTSSRSEKKHRRVSSNDQDDKPRKVRDTSRDRHDERHTKKERDKDRERSHDGDGRHARTERKANSGHDEKKNKEKRREKERRRALDLVKGKTRDEEGRVDAERREEDGQLWYESVKVADVSKLNESERRAWFEDHTGDPDVRKYGQPSSYNTPKYYRNGGGRILGLSDGLRIVLAKERTQRGLEIAPLGRPYVPRNSSRSIDGTTESHLRRIILRPATESDDLISADFTPFSIAGRKTIDLDVPQYRSIAKEDVPEEADELLEVLGQVSTLEDDLRRRTADLERHLQANPDDTDAWISYSTLHLKSSPDAARQRVSGVGDPSKLPTNRANSEITLSILSRALDACDSNSTSIKLHLAYLRTAENFWPPAKVTSRWQNVLRELGHGDVGGQAEEGIMEVWLGYIDWREGQGFGKSDEGKDNVGGVDEVVDVFIECLSRLRKGTNSNRQAREENEVYLFLRTCLFLKQAGYTERSLAAFQALMDITFFKPDHLRVRIDQTTPGWFDTVLNEYERFWDSELPRFGEPGASGWRYQTDVGGRKAEPSDPVSFSSTDPFEKWREAELHADATYGRPARATDLDAIDDEDPYRVVLFADIESLLFPVQNPDARLQLIYAYLNFLGLPLTPPEVPTTSPGRTDARLWWTLARNETHLSSFWPKRTEVNKITWQTIGGEAMDPERIRPLKTPFECPVKCFIQDKTTMFASSSRWFRDIAAADISALDLHVIRNSLSLLQAEVMDPLLSLTMFAVEAAVSPKAAVKSAKSILSQDRENFILWDGYARLERQRGNIQAARAVYVAAIQAAQVAKRSDLADEDEMDLWASWAEMEWEADEEIRALRVVVMAAGIGVNLASDSNPSSEPMRSSAIELLKARLHYTSLQPPFDATQLILQTLFAYYTIDVEAAREVVLRHISKIPTEGSQAEEAFQFLARLLQLHCSKHASPPSLLRNVLETAIKVFPNNTMFLSLYLWGESGGRVYGRVQNLVSSIISQTSHEAGVVGHLWSVWAESVSAHRTFWDQGGSGAERVRTALDHGINSSSGKQCVALWKLYIEFEAVMKRPNISKQLCYRAVTAIGGCKDLYLLPYTPQLRPHFTNRELRDWSQLIVERGIRIRIPFETFWSDEEEDEKGMILPHDEDLEDDELEFLRERQTMKPY